MSNLNSLVKDAESAIQALAAYANEQATEAAELRGEVSGLEDELSSAKGRISELEQELTTVEMEGG